MPSELRDPVTGDRVAIVTGGGHRDGEAITRQLATDGFSVAVAYLVDRSRADALVDDVFAAGGAAVAIRADVEDELDVERLFDETSEAFGGVDALVHAAGATDPTVVTRQAARRLRGGGAIVAVSTSAGRLEALVPPLARELGGREIAVSGVVRPPEPAAHDRNVAIVVAFLVSADGRSASGRVLRAVGSDQGIDQGLPGGDTSAERRSSDLDQRPRENTMSSTDVRSEAATGGPGGAGTVDMKFEAVVIPTQTTFASTPDLAGALRRAAVAHGEHEKRNGGEYDENWPDWYAAYMVAEYAGTELPR
jgi:3-oxoacyl-[acyl-carrier protein] reductase